MDNVQGTSCCAAGPCAADPVTDGCNSGPGASNSVLQLTRDLTHAITELKAVWPEGVAQDGIIESAKEILTAAYKAEREDADRNYRLEMFEQQAVHRENMMESISALVGTCTSTLDDDDDEPAPPAEATATEAAVTDQTCQHGTCSAASAQEPAKAD